MPAVGAVIRDRLQPIMSAHRLLLYAALSVLAIGATTLNAMRTYNNFYSVAIHLTRSGRSLLVCGLIYATVVGTDHTQILANFGIFLAFTSGRILQKILFGPLLPAEVEVRRTSGKQHRRCINLASASVRQSMVLHHRVPSGVHHLP